MDVQVAESGPCRRTLTIKVPPERIRGHLDRAFDAASRQVRLKGFRSGHVPRKVIEKKFGDAIRAEAKEQIVNESFNDAIRQHKLQVVGRPTIEGVDATPVDESAALEFTVHVEVRPEFELKDVKGIEIVEQPTAVTDDDVQNALRQLADQKKTLDAIDEPVAEGDFVRADLTFRNEGGEEVHRRDNAQLNANIPIAGTDPELFKANLLGKDKGASFTMELTFPATFDIEMLRGTKGSVEVALKEVQRVQPAPIDDELAKGFEFDTLDAMREELLKRIGEEKERAERMRREQAILDIIANDHPFELPETLVAEQTQQGLAHFREQLKQAKVPEAEIEARVEESNDEARKDAERRVRLFFLLDAIARKEKIFVTDADVDGEIAAVATRHGVTPEEVRRYYEEQQMIGDMRLGIMERKVRDFLRENAKITDTKTS